MEVQDKGDERKFPYATLKSMTRFFEVMKQIRDDVPDKVDARWLKLWEIEEHNPKYVLSSLGMMELIHPDGRTTARMMELGDGLQGTLGEIVEDLYGDLFQKFPRETLTRDMVKKYFEEYHGKSSQMAGRVTAIFVLLCKEANIDLPGLKAEAAPKVRERKVVKGKKKETKQPVRKEEKPELVEKGRKEEAKVPAEREGVRFPSIGPVKFREFMERVSTYHPNNKEAIAKAMGFAGARALGSYVGTGEVLGFTRDKEGDPARLELTGAGIDIKQGEEWPRRAIFQAFNDDERLGKLTKSLRERSAGQPLTREVVEERMLLYGGTPEQASRLSGIVLEWMVDGGLVEKNEEGFFLTDVGEAQTMTVDTSRLDEELYRRLVLSEFDERKSRFPTSYSAIEGAVEEFRKLRPESSEVDPKMRMAVGYILYALGFDVQCKDGPREILGKSPFAYGKPDSSDIKDDLLAIKFENARLYTGYALATEIKRGSPAAHAVEQAARHNGLIEREYQGAVNSLPCVISDSARYANKGARDSARRLRVLHVPLEGLEILLAEQLKRFKAGNRLILSIDIVKAIDKLRSQDNFEPTPEEFFNSVLSFAA